MNSIEKLEAVLEAAEREMHLAFEGDSREAVTKAVDRHAAATFALGNQLAVEATRTKLEVARQELAALPELQREWRQAMADVYREGILRQEANATPD